MKPNSAERIRGWATMLLLLISLAACASGGGAASRSASFDRELLTRAELDASVGKNLYEVVSTLRPNWMQSAVQSLGRESSTGPLVYMDGRRLGDAEQLRSVTTQAVESARFLSASRAQSKYGLADSRPVIDLVGRGSKP